jgi:Ni,Fe-hydrogenase III large subunit
LRVLFAELERIANHLGDTGFIANDTGFNFGGSQLTRLREVIMQLNEELTSSRFLRSVNTYGGVTKDIGKDAKNYIFNTLTDLEKDFSEIIDICLDDDSLMNRLKKTGILNKEIASDNGVVGVAARASGINTDMRSDEPYAAYPYLNFKKAGHKDSDVNARFQVRVQEIHSSIDLIRQVLHKMPEGQILNNKDLKLKPNFHAASSVEGWRGDIFYFVKTDNKGLIDRVAVRDPSFLNWQAVPYAVVGNIVPDFPLINKSFNLSYSGNDR